MSEFDLAGINKWLADNKFKKEKIVKVLILGNSGAGKSFLCNALVGSEVFTHDFQATSVTAVNSFVPAIVQDQVYVICNIPGLIEADTANIDRNKAAIDAAFRFQDGCPTICLFVATPVGGRIKQEDYNAIYAVNNFVKLQTAATAFIVNNVDFEELRDPDQYRATVVKQVHSNVDRGLYVELCPKLSKKKRSDYDSPEMRDLCNLLVYTLQRLTPVRMQPEPGAELILEHERLKKEFEQLKKKIEDNEALHKAMLEQSKAMWEAEVRRSEEAHKQRMNEMQQKIKELEARPPQVIYKGGGCFNAAVATVVDADTGLTIPMRDVRVGQWIVGCTKAHAAAPTRTRVLLIDRHEGDRVPMRRLAIADGRTIDLTPEHLILRRAGASAPVMVQTADVVAGDELCVADDTTNALAWHAVVAIRRTAAEPINVYTTDGTMLVSGVGASCYAVSEWWGWADMLPTRLLGAISPTLPAHPYYERLRAASDKLTDTALYALGRVRDAAYARLMGGNSHQ